MKGFYWLSKSYYAAANTDCIDEIMVGDYEAEGGCTGEFAIRWTKVGGESTPRLEAFEDSWKILADCDDLLFVLSELDGTNPAPEVIAESLINLGYKDLTRRENPYKKQETEEELKRKAALDLYEALKALRKAAGEIKADLKNHPQMLGCLIEADEALDRAEGKS